MGNCGVPDHEQSRRREAEQRTNPEQDRARGQDAQRARIADERQDQAAGPHAQQTASKDEERQRRAIEDAELAAPWQELDKTADDALKQSFREIRDKAAQRQADLDERNDDENARPTN